MPSPIREVLQGKRRWAVETADCIPFMERLPEACVDIVFFSPPYEDARSYQIDFKLKGQDWVDWMRALVTAAARVSRGLVAVNMSAKVRNRRYSCAVEWLVTDLTREDGLVCWPSPYAWVKMEDHDNALPNGIPGSGGRDCQRRDWEPVYCFARPENIPLQWTDNLAFGNGTKGSSFGGEFSNRDQDGRRANEHERAMTERTFQNAVDGSIKGSHRRVRPEVSNPGNTIWTENEDSVIRCPVGGGKLGHVLAHKSHAPMPVGLAERFVRWFCPPNGIVLDPCSGSGTTGHASLKHGRRYIGLDVWGGEGGTKTAIERLVQVEDSLAKKHDQTFADTGNPVESI